MREFPAKMASNTDFFHLMTSSSSTGVKYGRDFQLVTIALINLKKKTLGNNRTGEMAQIIPWRLAQRERTVQQIYGRQF